MSETTSSNFTGGHAFTWETEAKGAPKRVHVARPAEELNLHTHGAGLGLPVARIGTATASGALDMANNVITNIGNAGTDFNSSGGLTLAAALAVSSGGATVTRGGNVINTLTVNSDAADNYVGIQLNENGTKKWQVFNHFGTSPADALTIADASGNDRLFLHQSGELALPTQPAFIAYSASGSTNDTGNGNATNHGTLTEVSDRGTDFASNAFTAPVSGIYLFISKFEFGGIESGMTTCHHFIVTSNRTYQIEHGWAAQTNRMSFQMVVLADMDAGDTCTTTLNIFGGAGNNADLRGTDAGRLTSYFEGILLS